MRLTVPGSFVFAVILSIYSALPAQQPTKFDGELQKQFRGLETQWMDAAKARHRDRLEEFLAAGYMLTIAVQGKPLVHISRSE
jgi:hypothetical protein